MSISEALLEDWAAAPGDTKAQEAYKQVSDAVERSQLLQAKSTDKYLQGSYRNRTHIRADSDVDVVVELQSTFYYDIDALSTNEKSLFQDTYPNRATYTYDAFKDDVRQALENYYGSQSINEGNKCFKVSATAARSKADVLACLEHRKYQAFRSRNSRDQKYIPGIRFYTRNERAEIINWPKVHFSNGAEKNKKTDSMFKGLVRILKHIRNILIDHKLITIEIAPSYFIECLLYNVPNYNFGITYAPCLEGALSYLKDSDLNGFLCVNKQDLLFSGVNVWNTEDAKLFINYVIALNESA